MRRLLPALAGVPTLCLIRVNRARSRRGQAEAEEMAQESAVP